MRPPAPSLAWQRYTKHGVEATPEQEEAGRKEKERCDGEEEKKMCTFYFVSAKFILETSHTVLPKFQALREITTLMEHPVRLEDACRQQLSGEFRVLRRQPPLV